MNKLYEVRVRPKGSEEVIHTIEVKLDKSIRTVEDKRNYTEKVLKDHFQVDILPIPELNYRQIDDLFGKLFDLRLSNKSMNYWTYTAETYLHNKEDNNYKSRVSGLIELQIDIEQKEDIECELRFRHDWSWLMCAVEFINSTFEYEIKMENSQTTVFRKEVDLIITEVGDNMFKNTYNAVVTLLQKYKLN